MTTISVRPRARGRLPAANDAAEALLERQQRLQRRIREQNPAECAANYEQPTGLFVQLRGSWTDPSEERRDGVQSPLDLSGIGMGRG